MAGNSSPSVRFGAVLVSIRVYDDIAAVPLGAACIAAAIEASPQLAGRVSVKIVEAGPGEPASVLARRIMASDPDAVGFSLYCWNRILAEKTATILRRTAPDLILFAGGPEAEALFRDDRSGRSGQSVGTNLFDAVFRGEGEDSVTSWLCELLGGRAVREIPVSRGLPAAETLPSPWLLGTIHPEKGGSAVWELTRGCPYSCAYCYEGRGSHAVRRLPDARIDAELELFARSGTTEVFVLDPTFNLDRKRTLRLLGLFGEKAPGIRWQFEVRAELLDRAQAAAFARLDCFLQIGLQSSDPEVLSRVGRGIDRKAFAEKLSLLDREGVVYGLDLIYGLPGDTLEGFRFSVDFALGLGPNHLDIFPLSLLPGTEVADRAGDWGIDANPEPPYIVRGQPGFGPEDMQAASRLAEACSLFYSRGRAVPWFRAALAPLKTRPSAFLDGMPVRHDTVGLAHAAIESIQTEYLESAYRGRGLERLLPAVLDMVRFNGAWSRAFAEGTSTTLELSYPAEAVSSPDILDLRRFVAGTAPKHEKIRVEASAGGPVVHIMSAKRRKNA